MLLSLLFGLNRTVDVSLYTNELDSLLFSVVVDSKARQSLQAQHLLWLVGQLSIRYVLEGEHEKAGELIDRCLVMPSLSLSSWLHSLHAFLNYQDINIEPNKRGFSELCKGPPFLALMNLLNSGLLLDGTDYNALKFYVSLANLCRQAVHLERARVAVIAYERALEKDPLIQKYAVLQLFSGLQQQGQRCSRELLDRVLRFPSVVYCQAVYEKLIKYIGPLTSGVTVEEYAVRVKFLITLVAQLICSLSMRDSTLIVKDLTSVILPQLCALLEQRELLTASASSLSPFLARSGLVSYLQSAEWSATPFNQGVKVPLHLLLCVFNQCVGKALPSRVGITCSPCPQVQRVMKAFHLQVDELFSPVNGEHHHGLPYPDANLKKAARSWSFALGSSELLAERKRQRSSLELASNMGAGDITLEEGVTTLATSVNDVRNPANNFVYMDFAWHNYVNKVRSKCSSSSDVFENVYPEFESHKKRFQKMARSNRNFHASKQLKRLLLL